MAATEPRPCQTGFRLEVSFVDDPNRFRKCCKLEKIFDLAANT